MPQDETERPNERIGELDPMALIRWLEEARIDSELTDRSHRSLVLRVLSQCATNWPLRVVIYRKS